MKRVLFCAAAVLIAVVSSAQPTGIRLTESAPGLEYYLPREASSFDSKVPTPEQALGFNFGERIPEWTDIVSYMHTLENSSSRVSIKYFGRTFESRPFIQAVITSPKNQERLEDIRREHLSLNDPKAGPSVDIASAPLVINLMGSIHGNEISGATALLPVAYYYAASTDPKVLDLLDRTVIVITPGLNPDGMNSFATWVNENSSLNHYLTPESREYNQVMPRSRSNHYWMDCNRDWLAARFDVGVNCVEMYRYWRANVVLDLHEMGPKGKKGAYYFSPGDPRRTYAYTPQANQDLTEKISHSTAEALSSIGTKYFTKCNYDDFFIGKGAAYCDIQGGIGILHEQCSTRGHIAEFENQGVFVFPQTVRNQSYASFAVVSGSLGLKDELLSYQRDFAINSSKASAADASKAYVFGLKEDRGLTYEFIDNLRLHDIDVYKVEGEEGRYAVPLDQKGYYLVKCIFEDIRDYTDSTFYDISTWSQSRGFGVEAVLTEKMPVLGEKIGKAAMPAGILEEASDALAFAFVPSEYYATYLMSALQKQGISLKVATAPFQYKASRTKVDYPAGTIVIPVGDSGAGELAGILNPLCALCGVDVKALGPAKKFSLDALKLEDVRKPNVAILGTTQETGAMWYLLDRRYGIEHSVVNPDVLNQKNVKFDRFNMVFAQEPVPAAARKSLMKWVENGGTLLLRSDNADPAPGKSLGIPPVKNVKGLPMASKGVKGVVLKADVKNSVSPLLWGYTRGSFDLMKSKANFWTVPEGYETILEWNAEPWLSGCISKENIARVAGTPALVVRKYGKGVIILSDVDLNYRSYWLSTSHIVSNAAFFGDRIL